MDYLIEHELPGRMRIRLAGPVPDGDLDAFTTVLEEIPCVERAVVYPRIGSAAVSYRAGAEARDAVARHLSLIDVDAIDQARSRCVVSIAPRTHALMLDLATLVGSHFIRKLFMPLPLRAAWAAWRYRLFLKAALHSLGRSRLDVPVLDAAAIGIWRTPSSRGTSCSQGRSLSPRGASPKRRPPSWSTIPARSSSPGRLPCFPP